MTAIEQRKEQPGLPAGTRVQMKSQPRQKGTVMPYAPEYSHGLFPVQLDDGIWQKCDASDVIELASPKESRSGWENCSVQFC